jgi:hypothetical protein
MQAVTIFLVALALLMPAPAALRAETRQVQAPNADTAVSDGIQAVILGQIEAFRSDDFAAAFGFASDGIRRLFGSAERFGQMVRQGYPMVHRPAGLKWLDLREAHGRQMQRVQITDAQGRSHELLYDMVLTATGWKIAGVHLLPAPDVGV